MFVPPQIVRWSSRGQVVILRNVLVTSVNKYDTSLGLAAECWAVGSGKHRVQLSPARVQHRASISSSASKSSIRRFVITEKAVVAAFNQEKALVLVGAFS